MGRIKPRSIAQGLALVATASMLATGCAKAKSGDGADGTLTLWTHNAGNKEELAVVQKIVDDYNASQDEYEVELEAFPQESYNTSVV